MISNMARGTTNTSRIRRAASVLFRLFLCVCLLLTSSSPLRAFWYKPLILHEAYENPWSVKAPATEEDRDFNGWVVEARYDFEGASEGEASANHTEVEDDEPILGKAIIWILFGDDDDDSSDNFRDDFHQYDYGEDDDDDDESVGDRLTAALFLLALVGATSPWWGPPSAIDDKMDNHGRFPSHPYEDGHGGFLVLDSDPIVPNTPVRDFFVRAAIEGGTDFDDISRVGTNLHFGTRSRLGIDAGWADFNVRGGGTAVTDFSAGDANVILRFAHSEHAQWWTGVGMNWVDKRDTDRKYGANFTYGADVCLGDPWILSFQFDVGEYRYGHARLTVGAQRNGFEFYLGVDHTSVDVNDASTMVAGLRGWF